MPSCRWQQGEPAAALRQAQSLKHLCDGNPTLHLGHPGKLSQPDIKAARHAMVQQYLVLRREALMRCAGSSEQFLSMRAAYTASLAAVSMAGYVAGVGDRHTDNFLLDLASGALVPIDFGSASCLPKACCLCLCQGCLQEAAWKLRTCAPVAKISPSCCACCCWQQLHSCSLLGKCTAREQGF